MTVRGVPGPAPVTSRATAGLLFVTVTVIELPPARIACAGETLVFGAEPLTRPTRATNGSEGESVVVDRARLTSSIPGCATNTVPVASVKPGADAVSVTPPVAPSMPWT